MNNSKLLKYIISVILIVGFLSNFLNVWSNDNPYSSYFNDSVQKKLNNIILVLENKKETLSAESYNILLTDFGKKLSEIGNKYKSNKAIKNLMKYLFFEVDILFSNSISYNSPFGFHPGSAEDYSYSNDLNSTWSRGEGQYVVWDWIDKDRNGNFSFKNVYLPAPKNNPNFKITKPISYDDFRLETPDNINIVRNISPFRKGGKFNSEEEKEVYSEFVKKVVERYDGDDDLGCTQITPDCYNKGDNDYPSQELIEKSELNPIKYWQVGNQLFDSCEIKTCKDTYAEKYAEVMKITYEAAKEADSSVSVLIAGDSLVVEYPKVFEELGGKYIDIIDKHYFGEESNYHPKEEFDFLKTHLVKSGFDLDELRFWVTETGTYSGDPISPANRRNAPDLPYQSEVQQANGLFKRYVSSLGYGIEKIFWAWNIVEGFKRDGGIFDYTGIVYDGCEYTNNKYQCGGVLEYDQGKGKKKLAYYTYKLMVEKLNDSDFNSIDIISESDGIYIYKFKNLKTGQFTWVAWNDNKSNESINLNIKDISYVKITEVIPKYDTGIQVTNYDSAFKNYIKVVKDGFVTIELGDKPVFIEKK